MANNIDIKDATGTTKTLRTVDDGTGKQYNQSIPTDTQGNTAAVTSNAQAARSTDGALVIAFSPNSSLPAGTALIGKVSIAGAFDVSVGSVVIADNAPVSVRGGLVGLNAGTQFVGAVSVRQIVSVVPDGTGANFPVSVAVLPKLIANTDKVVIGAVSLADGTLPTGPVTQSGTWTVQIGNTPNTVPVLVTVNNNIAVSVQNTITVGTHAVTQSGVWAVNAALTSTNNNVALTSIGSNPVAVGTGAAATALRVAIAPNADKTNIGQVSIGDALVRVCNADHVFDASGFLKVNVAAGGAAGGTSSNFSAAFPATGTAIGAEVTAASPTLTAGQMSPLSIDTSGRLRITGSITASSLTQTVAAAVTTEGYPMLGSDLTVARRIVTDTTGRLAVNVSNVMPAHPVSIADGVLADSAGGGGTLAVQSLLIGAEVSTALPTLTVKKQGPLQLTTSGQLRVAASPANTDKVVIGAVSLADGTLPTGPVTQSGTWTVQIGNTPNTVPVLVTVNSNIAVSVQGGLIGLNAGTNAIGKLTANTDKLVIGAVSLADSAINVGSITTLPATPAGTNLIGGVSVRGIVSVVFDGANANMPVSVGTLPKLVANTDKVVIGAVSIADSTLAAAQSGTWTVQIGNTANTTPVLVTVNSNIAVSVQGGLIGLNAGTNAIGKLTANTDKLVIGAVSVADTALKLTTAGDKVVIGAVSLAGISPVSIAGVVTVGSFTNVSATAPTGAFFIGGVDPSGDLIGMKLDSTGTQKIGGYMTTPLFAFTRPANTTAYTANDTVNDNVTAGSNTPMSWPISRFNAGTAQNIAIRRARIKTTKTTNHRGQNFRIHLWNKGSNSTNSNANVSNAGDNAAFAATKAGYYVGAIDVSCDYLFSDGVGGTGVPRSGAEINIVTSATGQVSITGWLEVLTSTTPISGQVYTTWLEIYQD